jgi:hypothetical protein
MANTRTKRQKRKRKHWEPGDPGTPPQIGETRAESRVIVVVTEEQKQQIKTAATAAGKSESSWARDILLAAAGKTEG